MKLLHIADLHIGKRLNEFSLIEDQDHILRRILNIADDEQPDAVLIAGDVYDKAVPSVEAVDLLGFFLTSLSRKGIRSFVIAGNHDSAERLAFLSDLLDVSGVHIAPAYDGKVEPVSLTGGNLTVDVFMLPFIRPSDVKRCFPTAEISSFTDAVSCALRHIKLNGSHVNILMSHQFVTGAATCDSEERYAGGLDNVDASAFSGFDYVALGHLHGPQSVGSDEYIRYSGTPLKYSFSELSHRKSVTVLDIHAKGDIDIYCVPLIPLRDMRELRGSYEELVTKENYVGTATGDYLRVSLTDEEEILNAMARLRVIYPNIMELRYDNERTRKNSVITAVEAAKSRRPEEYFMELYEKQNNRPMTQYQKDLVMEILAGMEKGAGK